MASMEELKQSIVDNLKIELSKDDDFDENILALKVELVLDEAIERRGFTDNHTDEQILKYLIRHKSSLSQIAMRDYNQVGAESETQHSENEIERTWTDRDKMWSFIIPLSRHNK